jgi:hypothetical protein
VRDGPDLVTQRLPSETGDLWTLVHESRVRRTAKRAAQREGVHAGERAYAIVNALRRLAM